MISIIVLSLVMTSYASDQIEGYGAYDENYAYKLWLLCSASYCGQDRIRNWNCHKPCDDTAPLQDITVLLNSSSEVAGYTAYDPKNNNIYIVLRGTVPWQIKNWVEDIDFIKTSYPYCNNGCQVHRGFYHSFQSIEKQLLNSVKAIKALHSSATITITGHSLGGALATHALVYLTKQGYKINKFYTFGSPRVGDKAFFEWLSRTLFTGEKFRITHSHDPVPHLPLYDQGFHHINTEAYYKEILWVFKQFTICNDSLQEDPHCANSNLLDLNINDHMDYMGYNIAVETLTCQ